MRFFFFLLWIGLPNLAFNQTQLHFSPNDLLPLAQPAGSFAVDTNYLVLQQPPQNGSASLVYSASQQYQLLSFSMAFHWRFNPSGVNNGSFTFGESLEIEIAKDQDRIRCYDIRNGTREVIALTSNIPTQNTLNQIELSLFQRNGYYSLHFSSNGQLDSIPIPLPEITFNTWDFTVFYTSSRSTKTSIKEIAFTLIPFVAPPTIAYSFPHPDSLQVDVNPIPDQGWKVHRPGNTSNLISTSNSTLFVPENPGELVDLEFEFHFPDTVISKSDTIQHWPIKGPDLGDLRISELMPDPSPPIGLPNQEYVEIYNSSSWIIPCDSFLLYKKTSPWNLGNCFLYPESVLTLSPDPDSLLNSWSPPSWKSLLNTQDSLSIIAKGNPIDIAQYTSNTLVLDGRSLERVFSQLACPNEEQWILSEHEAGGTPGELSTRNTGIFAPKITIQTRPDSVFLNGSIQITGLNSLHWNGIQTSFQIQKGNIQFPIPMSSLGQQNQLEVEEISFCNQEKSNVDTSFIMGTQPLPGQLWLSEFLPDPNPTIGLADAEFIEITNSSDQFLQLDSVILRVNQSEMDLPNWTLGPNSSLVLCSETDSFPGINCLDVPGWKTLPNGGASLSLSAPNGLLDSVDYKQLQSLITGGRSLQRHQLTSCPDFLNWSPNSDSTGGTPGVYSPQDILQFTPIFSLNSRWEIDLGPYPISNPDLLLIRVDGVATNFELVGQTIFLNREVVEHVEMSYPTYSCSGYQSASWTASLPPKPKKGAVFITETLADPSPDVGLGTSEFITIHTTASLFPPDLIFNINGDQSTWDTVGVILPGTHFLDKRSGLFTSLSNSGFTLQLYTDSILLDSLEYSTDNFNTIQKGGGYSLRRNWENSCPVPFGWSPSELPPLPPVPWEPKTKTLPFELPDTLFTNPISFLESAFISQIDLLILNGIPHTNIQAALQETTLAGWNSVQVHGLQFCHGIDTTWQFQWYIPNSEPQKNDLLISEVLADPGTGEEEFLEIWNRTETWIPANSLSIRIQNQNYPITHTYIQPQGILVLQDQDIPGLSNTGFNLSLVYQTNSMLDSVTIHKSDISDGVSLHRQFFSANCALEKMWMFGEPNPGTLFTTALYQEDSIKLTSVYTQSDTLRLGFNLPIHQNIHPFLQVDSLQITACFKLGDLNWGCTMEGPLPLGTSVPAHLLPGLENCLGKPLNRVDFQMDFPMECQLGDLRISEFLADPTPPLDSVLFPEFVEIINLKNALISLNGLRLSVGSQHLDLEGIIGPNGSLAFTEEHDLMALPNGGFTLQLKKDSLVLDQVRYLSENHTGIGPDGGISLQRVSFQDSCSNLNNWTWSLDSLGANPGYPDVEKPLPPPPTIVDYSWSDSSLLFLTNIPINTFNYLGNTWIQEGSQFSIPISPSNGGNLVVIDSLRDCFFRSGKDSLLFFNGAVPKTAAITEVLFSPLDSCPEFVEIMFLDTGWIQLREVSLVLGTKEYTLPNSVILAPIQLALSSEKFPNTLLQNGMAVSNSLDSIFLQVGSDTLDFLKGLQARLKTLHGSGVPEQSLEKGDIHLPCASMQNWHLCTNINGHTLGKTNSQETSYANGVGPYLDSMQVYRSDSILLYFSEPIPLHQLPDFTPNLALFPTDPFDPILLKSSFGEEQNTVISNMADCYQEKGRDTIITIPWIKSPSNFGDLRITEFTCATPNDSLFSDIIELSNTRNDALQLGDLLKLRELGITGVIPPHKSIIFPLDCGAIKDSLLVLSTSMGSTIDSCWNPLFKKENQAFSWKRKAALSCPDLQYHWIQDSVHSLGQYPDTLPLPSSFHPDLTLNFCSPTLRITSTIPITQFQSNFPSATSLVENRTLKIEFTESGVKTPEVEIQNMARCGVPDTSLLVPSIWVPDSLWINEIMYEPEDEQTEFVELYVPDTNWVSLCGCAIQVNNNYEELGNQGLLKGPFIVLSKIPLPLELGLLKTAQNVFDLPSLNNSGASIQLFSQQGDLLDSLAYKPQWHTGFSSERRGTSLELTDDGLLGKRAWFSSGATWGATPGKSNSIKGRTADAWDVDISNRLLDPWDLNQPQEIFITLQQLTPGTRVSAGVFHPKQGEIKRLLDDTMVPNVLELRWDGSMETSGHIAAVGPYLIILEIQEPDQVIEQLKIPVYIWNP